MSSAWLPLAVPKAPVTWMRPPGSEEYVLHAPPRLPDSNPSVKIVRVASIAPVTAARAAPPTLMNAASSDCAVAGRSFEAAGAETSSASTAALIVTDVRTMPDEPPLPV